MTSRAIRRLRKRATGAPTSASSHPDTKRAYRSWEYLMTLYRDWVYATERGRARSKTPPVHLPWVQSFDAFFADMGQRPRHCTISRPDSTRPYGPDNCSWAPRTGKAGPSPRLQVTFNGETLSVPEWSDRLRIPAVTIYCRLKRGLSGAAALGLAPAGAQR
jgi:hypothetical protein